MNKASRAKIGRNDPCICGSGKKFKKCCMNADKDTSRPDLSLQKEYKKKHNIILKQPHQIEGIKKSGKLLLSILDKVEKMIKPGITTDMINDFVHEEHIRAGAIPAPLNYRGFPKSVCTSVNEVVCHGIPGELILNDGDIINVDITPILNNYYTDASKTFFVGTPSKDGQKIVDIAKKALKRGINAVKPGATLGDIGYAIQSFAEAADCSVVREFIGHGVGIEFHEQPQVLHYGIRGDGIKLVPGMV